VEAIEVVKDGENAIIAAMRKPNSSMAVATKLVKDGKARCGGQRWLDRSLHGQCLSASGLSAGIERPIVGGAFLKLAPNTFMLDMGANVGCQGQRSAEIRGGRERLRQEVPWNRESHRGTSQCGAEEGKGNEVVKEAYSLLKESGLNFIGNVEGMDIPTARPTSSSATDSSATSC